MSFMRLTRRRLGGCLASLAGAAALAATLALPAHAADAAPRVQFVTSEGSFVIELYPDKAPKTVENFLQYVNDKFYDGTVFHRVIKGFMVQGGGFDKDYRQKPTRPSVKHEGRESAAKGLHNTVGMVAMARTGDPHSATAQFFINVADNGFLNHTAPTPQGWGYAVFGKVISGQNVVDAIKAVPTGSKGFHENVPRADVVIEKAVAL